MLILTALRAWPSAAAVVLTLTVLVPRSVRADEPLAVARVYDMERGQEVTVEGTVRDFRGSSRPNIPNSFMIQDESGTIRVAIWPIVFDEIPRRGAISDGVWIKVTGRVAEYRGMAEIHVQAPSGVEISAPPPEAIPASAPATGESAAPPPSGLDAGAAPFAARIPTGPPVVHPGITPVVALTRDRLDHTFTISGTLSSARRPSSERAPYILRVADATGEIDVVFWEDLAERLPESKKVEPGDRLQVTGRLSEHLGMLQIRLDSPADLKTPKSDPKAFRATGTPQPGEGAVASRRAEAERVAPGAVASLPPGRRVSVEGRVASIEPLRLGRKVRLQDETSTGPEAVILLWDTAEGLKPEVHDLKTSSTLSVAGTVAEARGEKVLVVSDPEDVLKVTLAP